MSAVRNVDAVIVPAWEPLGEHGPHCPICEGGNVGTHMVHLRDGEARVDAVARLGHCLLWSGVDWVRSLLPQGTAPTGGGAA